MGLLTKLKSLLGFEDDRSQMRRGESGVTIERDPDESAEPDAEVESAVKGVDAGGEESTSEPATDREATATGPGSDETDDGGPTTTPEGIEEAESGVRDAEATDSGVETADSEVEATDSEVEAGESATDEVDAGQTEAEPTEAEPTEAEPDFGAGEVDESEAESASEATGVEEATTDETTTDETTTDETTTDETATDETATDETAAVAAGEPLEDVKGIGPAYAERLRDAGVADVADLAGADADRLAEETDLSAKRISRWIERAGAR